MSPASELFAKARAALLVGAPFWGVLSLRLAPVEGPTVSTMQTDGVSIRFNPDFVTGLSRAVLRTAIAHETMHCAALHHTRRGNRDLRRWNIACDYAINPLLAEAGFEMPEGVLLDPAYAGMSAEEIYDKLPHDTGNDGDDQASDDPGGMGGVTDPPAGRASTSDASASSQAEPARPIRYPGPLSGRPGAAGGDLGHCHSSGRSNRQGHGHQCRRRRPGYPRSGDAQGRLARCAAPLSFRRRQVRLYLDPAEPALYRPRALPALAAQRNPRAGRRRC